MNLELVLLIACLAAVGFTTRNVGSFLAGIFRKDIKQLYSAVFHTLPPETWIDKGAIPTSPMIKATELIPSYGVSTARLAEKAQLASLAAETEEDRSIMQLVSTKYRLGKRNSDILSSSFIKIKAQSGVGEVEVEGVAIRKGSVENITRNIGEQGSQVPDDIKLVCEMIQVAGGIPVLVAEAGQVLGVVHMRQAGAWGYTAGQLQAELGNPRAVSEHFGQSGQPASWQDAGENRGGQSRIPGTGYGQASRSQPNVG